MRKLEEFLRPSQEKLYKNIIRWAGEVKAKSWEMKKKFVLVKGEAPIMLVAHLDTVHKKTVKYICKTSDDNILMSPQGIGGDDRCGVYALVNVFEMSDKKPWLLFTCDEEIGGVGAEAFSTAYSKGKLPKELAGLKCIIEVDRKGRNDAVYYDCDNADFEKYITGKGFKTQHGSFSDISYIAPDLGVAAVNLSSGYYNAHTEHEYIVRSEIDAVIGVIVDIVAEAAQADFPKYEWVKRKEVAFNYGGRTSFWSIPSSRGHSYSTYDQIPWDLPYHYFDAYDYLLEIYTKKELEDLRANWGDDILQELYEMEFDGINSREMIESLEAEAEDDAKEEELKCAN